MHLHVIVNMSLSVRTSALIRQVPKILKRFRKAPSLLETGASQWHHSARSIHISRTNLHGDYEWQDPKSEDEV